MRLRQSQLTLKESRRPASRGRPRETPDSRSPDPPIPETGLMNSTTERRRPLRDNAWAIGLAAVLSLVVLAIHVKDQGGFPGDKDPGYIKVLYYVLEAACVLTVALLLSYRTRVLGWLLAVGVAAGPIIGYVLTRGPG